LNGLTQAEIQDYYFSELDASDALLVIAGDISVKDALALAEANFGQMLANGTATSEPLVDPSHSDTLQIFVVNRPGPQTSFILGNFGTDSRDPNRDRLRVLNEILGGGINSRLFQEVREQQGLTYSIGSGFSFRQADGTFTVSAASDNEVVVDAIREVFKQIDTIRTEQVTSDELETTINELVGSEALSLESLQTFINRVASAKLNDEGLERIANLPERLAGIDQEALLDAAQQYIRPDEFIIVAVGDASFIEAPLSELGPVTIIEAE
jgi:predicted Zn-dependent peptidase